MTIIENDPPQGTGTELIVVGALVPAVVFADTEALDKVLDQLRAEVRRKMPSLDVSTEKGRKAIRSLNRKVASSKTALDEMGKDLGADYRAKVDRINADRRHAWEECEKLQAEITERLDKWEAKEKARKEAMEALIAEIVAAPQLFAATIPGEPSQSDFFVDSARIG